ncbi:MAG: hypothetical protein MJY72_06695 [Bacteroidales bacterium]|nr:hypothetical protein [Bacteroidales bacterium]
MKVIQQIFSFAVKVAAVGAVALASQCCTKSGLSESSGIQANLRITLVLPDTKAPAGDTHTPYDNSHLHEGSDNMLVLNDLDFVFFTEAGEYVTSATGRDHVTLGAVEYDSADKLHRYNADVKVDGVVNGQAYRVVVLANRRRMYSGALPFSIAALPAYRKPASYPGTDEQYLYSQLEMSSGSVAGVSNSDLTHYTQLNLSAYDEARVPMWGVQKMTLSIKAEENLGSLSSSGDIRLLRSIAKVKVSVAPELAAYVKVTDHVTSDPSTGAVMHYSRDRGYMSVSYAMAASSNATPGTFGMDKVAGTYSNANLNLVGSEVPGTYVTPMYKDVDGSYYMYLPEQAIGEAWMTLEFQYLDTNLAKPLKVQKTLQFADYTAATADLLGGKDIPLTEDQLQNYRFPVMRNHYYVYTVTKLDPFMLKYEICEWAERTAPDIIFN